MNERIPSDPELGGSSELPESPAAAGRMNASRRRFAKAGVASPVVLGSLLSKPALATQPYNCTISGQMSGNTSPRPGAVDCKTLGKSPGYWKNNGWPTGAFKGSLADGNCGFGTNNVNRGTLFGGLTVGGQTLIDAFRFKSESSLCNVYGMRDPGYAGCTGTATLLQVLYTPGGLNDTMIYALGRSTVATILNALNSVDYPLTVAQTIKMFNAVAPLGGRYQVNATVSWDADQVLTYFKSLYN
jgi:hypothetical protein